MTRIPGVETVHAWVDVRRARRGLPARVRPRIRPTRLGLRAVARTVEPLHGPAAMRCQPGEAVGLCVVRDAEETLEAFLDHHARLGLRHLFLLDNGSRDRTVEIACSRPDVSVLRSCLAFGSWARPLRAYLRHACLVDGAGRPGGHGWCLQLDADELFDYPGSARVPLPVLLRHLEDTGADAMAAHLLELFGPGPLRQPATRRGLLEAHPCYDLGGLEARALPDRYRLLDPGLRELRGGIRRTVFAGESEMLLKFPLVRLSGRLGALDVQPHALFAPATLADTSGVLLHFQLTATLAERAARAVAEQSHAHGSRKYRRFLEVLEAEPDLSIHEKAIRPRSWKGSDELLATGFLRASDAWLARVAAA